MFILTLVCAFAVSTKLAYVTLICVLFIKLVYVTLSVAVKGIGDCYTVCTENFFDQPVTSCSFRIV